MYEADAAPEATPTTPARLVGVVPCHAGGRPAGRGPCGPAQVAIRAYRLADGLAGRLDRRTVVRVAEAGTPRRVLAALEAVEAFVRRTGGSAAVRTRRRR